jgi:hypothetical protein
VDQKANVEDVEPNLEPRALRGTKDRQTRDERVLHRAGRQEVAIRREPEAPGPRQRARRAPKAEPLVQHAEEHELLEGLGLEVPGRLQLGALVEPTAERPTRDVQRELEQVLKVDPGWND